MDKPTTPEPARTSEPVILAAEPEPTSVAATEVPDFSKLSTTELDKVIRQAKATAQRQFERFRCILLDVLYPALCELETRYDKKPGARTDLHPEQELGMGWHQYLRSVGVNPTSFRSRKSREALKAVNALLLPAPELPEEEPETKPKKCGHCGTKINLLPKGQEPAHDENCPQHPMRLKSLDILKNAAVRAETYEQLVAGTGRFSAMKPAERTAKMQELVLGSPVSKALIDAGEEFDEFNGLLNSIRGRDAEEMVRKANDFFGYYADKLKLLGLILPPVRLEQNEPKPKPPTLETDEDYETQDAADADDDTATALQTSELGIASGPEDEPEATTVPGASKKQKAAQMLAWVREHPEHGLTHKQLGEKFGMAGTSVGYYLRSTSEGENNDTI